MKIININKENSTFQQILSIRDNRKKRYNLKKIFVEGVNNINRAIESGWEVDSWLFSDFSMLSNWAKDRVKNTISKNNYSFSESLMQKISEKSKTSELIAIFTLEDRVIDLKNNKNPFIILFDRPSKKGNFGTLIRTCDAFGIDGIIVTGHSIDIYDPEIITTSMGSYFTTQIESITTNDKVFERLNHYKEIYNDLQIIATTELGDMIIDKIDYNKPTVLLLGNERDGISQFLLQQANILSKIPMCGKATSLNVACAGSIFMYQAFMQRIK